MKKLLGRKQARIALALILVFSMMPSAGFAVESSSAENTAAKSFSVVDEQAGGLSSNEFALSEDDIAEAAVLDEVYADEAVAASAHPEIGEAAITDKASEEALLLDNSLNADETDAALHGVANVSEMQVVSTEDIYATEATEQSTHLGIVGQRLYTQAYQVLDLVNQQRAAAGLSALTMDDDLLDAAMLRGFEISVGFSHTRPDGTTCFTACSKMSGENIAAGSTTASGVMDQWMNSSGHRANILTSGYKSIGIGCVVVNGVYYWVQCFGSSSSSQASQPSDGYIGCAVAYTAAGLNNLGTIVQLYYLTNGSNASTSNDLTIALGDEKEYAAVISTGGWAYGRARLYLTDGTTMPQITAGSDYNDSYCQSGCWYFYAGSSGAYTVSMILGEGGPSSSLTHYVSGSYYPSDIAKIGIVDRLSGLTRYDTMRTIMKTGFSSADTVVIASGANFPDALGASALAGTNDAPILLTASDTLSWQTCNEIKRLNPEKAYIIGGTSAISSGVESSIRSLGVTTERVSGDTRQLTAQAISNKVCASETPDTVIVASSAAPWDSLSISSYAYAKKYPVLLTESNGKLSSQTIETLRSSGATRVIIVGGTASVAKSVESTLTEWNTIRLGGSDRYETAQLIADFVSTGDEGMSSAYIGIASSAGFADALSGCSMVGKNLGITLLTDPTDSSKLCSTLEKLNDDFPVRICYLFGGENAASVKVQQDIAEILE